MNETELSLIDQIPILIKEHLGTIKASLVVVRRGQTGKNVLNQVDGRSTSRLTPDGRTQAQTVANLLQKLAIKPTFIYASPLLRTEETAQIIAQFFGIINVHVNFGLIERDFGRLQDKQVADTQSLINTGFLVESHVLGELINNLVEPPEILALRGLMAIVRIMKHHPNQIGLIVTHSALMRYLLGYIDDRNMTGYPAGSVANTAFFELMTDGTGMLKIGRHYGIAPLENKI
jgi:broad specificity phosphatase PhoE